MNGVDGRAAEIKLRKLRSYPASGRRTDLSQQLDPHTDPLDFGASTSPSGPTRPRQRSECGQLGRTEPCPWVSCQYHLSTDVSPTGTLSVYELPWAPGAKTCVLAEAELGPKTLDDIGALLLISRERTRQLEARSLARMRPIMERAGIDAEAFGELLESKQGDIFPAPQGCARVRKFSLLLAKRLADRGLHSGKHESRRAFEARMIGESK